MEVRFLSPKLRTGCDNSNLLHVYIAFIKKEGNLTFDSNELIYNFLSVLRELIANRFCYICDWKRRELRGEGLGHKKPYH